MSMLSHAFSQVTDFFGGDAKDMSKDAFAAGTPFSGSRPFYENMLKELMQDPSKVKDQPGFKFGMDQGIEAVKRNASSTGFSGSGNEMLEIEKFAQGYADQFFMGQENFLAQLAGSGITPNTSSAVQAQQNSFDQRQAGLGDLGKLIGAFM